jgi:hypothetical protein
MQLGSGFRVFCARAFLGGRCNMLVSIMLRFAFKKEITVSGAKPLSFARGDWRNGLVFHGLLAN